MSRQYISQPEHTLADHPSTHVQRMRPIRLVEAKEVFEWDTPHYVARQRIRVWMLSGRMRKVGQVCANEANI